VYLASADRDKLDLVQGLVLNNMRAPTAENALRTLGSEAIKLRGAVAELIHCHGGDAFLRPLNGDERDLALGFPRGASAASGRPSMRPPPSGAAVSSPAMRGLRPPPPCSWASSPRT